MTFWFGIGIMQLLDEEYNEHYPDEILNRLFDKLESWLADDIEIREVLLKPGIDLYTELAPTEKPTVIVSSFNRGGVLRNEIACPIIEAIQNVTTIDFAPYHYCSKMPDPIADILVPGFSRQVQLTEETKYLLDYRVKLEDFCIAPLNNLWVGGLEQHLIAFTTWRDRIRNDSDYMVFDEVSREDILEFYDEMLLPMLNFCNEHRLIFVFGF